VPGELVQDGSNAPLLQDMYTRVELGADGVLLGVVSVEADGTDPCPSDDAGSPLRDFVVHGAGLGTPRHIDPGDAIPAVGSSSIEDPGLTGLLLLGRSVLHPYRSIGGRWRTVWSMRVRRSPSQRGC
jgi:hypothetical protein